MEVGRCTSGKKNQHQQTRHPFSFSARKIKSSRRAMGVGEAEECGECGDNDEHPLPRPRLHADPSASLISRCSALRRHLFVLQYTHSRCLQNEVRLKALSDIARHPCIVSVVVLLAQKVGSLLAARHCGGEVDRRERDDLHKS